MSQYLPFGKQIILTQEQINDREAIYQAYDYYGIPYGQFNYVQDGEGYSTKKDKDRELARMLINFGKPIPKELEERLLKYKQQELIKA